MYNAKVRKKNYLCISLSFENTIMKKLLTICVTLFMAVTNMAALEKITIGDITGGKFAAKTISGIDPIDGTDMYVRISDDKKQILKCSFRTGKTEEILFDVNNTMGEKIKEFDGYIMSPDGKRMLIQTQTERIYRRSFKAVYYIYTISSHKLEKLSDGGPQQIPTWSLDGMQVAFVRDNNIHLVKLLYDNAESEVTKDGKKNEIINGIPDWVNEEEFGLSRSLVFNADGSMICWIKYDETKVRNYSLQYFKGSNPTFGEYEDYPGDYTYKYPKAGHDNSIVSVWSYEIKTHKTRKLQVPVSEDSYIPRIKMTSDAQKIIVYTLNRHQDELCLYAVNPRSTVSQLIIKENVPKYVKEEAIEGTIIGKSTILLPSDRDGYMHIYIYGMNGQLVRKVGDGNHDITAIYGYDESTGDVYYQSAALNAHDRQVYVAHKNGKTERLTEQEGWNSAIFSADFKYFINTWSDYNTPYVYTVRNNSGKILSTILDNHELKQTIQQYGFTKKETFSFTTSEGVRLDGWMVKPADFDASRKYPVVMFQYSGPGSQQVVNSWNAGSMGQGGAFDYYLASEGFVVVCVDGRGTGGRGSEFEKSVYLRLGDLESKDQVETALYLSTLPYVDKDNIGIWGWSYGGFNTLMSMSEGRHVFKAGVAVAAPTNWKYYDTVYTERYMRTPKENAAGYAINPIERADKLNGALLLCHGLSDDNVHPQNVFEYSEALVQADKDFKENFYVNRNHSIYGGNTRNHLMRQISQFFIDNLKK